MKLEVNQLSFRNGDGDRIVDGLQFQVEPGLITVLVGKSGSGKSTLLHMLAGLKAPADNEGCVLYGGRPLWGRGQPDRRLLERIGFVYQYPEHQFFLPTVRDELLYSLKPSKLSKPEKEHRIREASEVCGLREEHMERSPFFLSGGEKRKAALASVLVTDPDWLLLDEPSSGLDSGMGQWLVKHLIKLKLKREGRGGILIATHDLDLFLPIADQVLVLKEGRLEASCTPEELEHRPELLMQAGVGVPACLELASMCGERSHKGGQLEVTAIADRMEAWISKDRGLKNGPIPKAECEIRMLEGASYEEAAEDISRNENRAAEAPHSAPASLDPRTKWLIYLLFSLGTLLQPGWAVTAAASGAVLLVSWRLRKPLSSWRKPILPMLWFMLLSFIIAGIQLPTSVSLNLSGMSFDSAAGVETITMLVPLIPVMAGGVLFAQTTDSLAMKKGMEALLNGIPGFRKPAETIALATSLLFRFMKWIPAELERFASLTSIRGKKGGKPGRLRLSQLGAFFTPLLLAIMQHAEEMSLALEARGYKLNGEVNRTNAAPLRFTRKDGAACLAGTLFACFLVLLGRL